MPDEDGSGIKVKTGQGPVDGAHPVEAAWRASRIAVRTPLSPRPAMTTRRELMSTR
jgi:hypothetical protein